MVIQMEQVTLCIIKKLTAIFQNDHFSKAELHSEVYYNASVSPNTKYLHSCPHNQIHKVLNRSLHTSLRHDNVFSPRFACMNCAAHIM